jgi:hypothetical protein
MLEEGSSKTEIHKIKEPETREDIDQMSVGSWSLGSDRKVMSQNMSRKVMVIAQAKGVWDSTGRPSSMNLVYDPKTCDEIDGMGRESLLSWIRSKGYGVAGDLSRGRSDR